MAVRELYSTQYDSKGYTNEASLVNLMLSKPDSTSRKMTYLWGKDRDKFPLTFLTEAQAGGYKPAPVNNVEYTWDVMGRFKITDEVVAFDAVANPAPGIANTPFQVIFKENWFPAQWGLMAPDGTRYRIMENPRRVGNGYLYTLEGKATTAASTCSLGNLQPGRHWVMTAPTVAQSLSRGNRSNVMAPGKMTNQLSFIRYTKTIAGNLANKVVPIQFDGSDTKDGNPTSLWINEEMRQFEILMRQTNEEHYWDSQYNRRTDGSIVMKDYDSGQPITEGAGMFEIIKSYNADTYGLELTLSKLKNTISDVFYSDTDSGTMEVVLYCGLGFMEDFDNAIKSDVSTNQLFYKLSQDSIRSGKDGYLTYGAYFTQYQHISGHIVTLKQLRMLDFGAKAEMQKKNAMVHPRTGKPICSHAGYFVDHSIYDGERNITMYYEEGRSEIRGVVKGLSPIPTSWGAVPTNSFSNDKDESSYEIFTSKGVNIANATRCFAIECQL